MTTIAATEAKNRFGELLESALKEPVEISKKGRTVAVVLSVETFQELKEKAEEKSKTPQIDGILNWIERHPSQNKPMDEQDYYDHLDEKYA